MAEDDDDKPVQKTYRLPKGQVNFIEELARLQILGGTPSAVVRTLLNNAIKDLIDAEFVRKYRETSTLLKK